jgi:hypothetical protein
MRKEVSPHVLKFRLTHLAVLAALVVPSFLGKLSWLGFADGAH